MSEVIADQAPTDSPWDRAGRMVRLPWWLPVWVLVVCSVGLLVIGGAMALVITLPG